MQKKPVAHYAAALALTCVTLVGGNFSAQAQNYDQPTTGTTNLPTYAYDPKYDPQQRTYVTSVAQDNKTSGKTITLGTVTGFQIGLQASDYRYQEHVAANQDFMHLTGANFGATVEGMKTYTNGFFWGGDLRVAYGSHDYTGGDVDTSTGIVYPSTHSGEDDFLADVRLVGGHDFVFERNRGSFSIAPYAGIGFRYLYNDGRGEDTNGVSGYERTSHYVYIPVGITPRIRVTDLTRLSLNLEYDQLIYGSQTSYLGDTITGATDLTNSQHGGYGARGSLMYEWPKWSLGPFFNYWNINQSDAGCDNVACGVEPHNQTIEYGMQGKYRF